MEKIIVPLPVQESIGFMLGLRSATVRCYQYPSPVWTDFNGFDAFDMTTTEGTSYDERKVNLYSEGRHLAFVIMHFYKSQRDFPQPNRWFVTNIMYSPFNDIAVNFDDWVGGPTEHFMFLTHSKPY